MGHFIRNLAIIAISAGFLAGCVANMAFDAGNAASVRRIAFTGFDEPKYTIVGNGGFVGLSGDELNAAMAKQNLHLGAELKTAVAMSLENAGYAVQTNGDTGSADAVLNARFLAVIYGPTGSIILGRGANTPQVVVEVRLTELRTRQALFAKVYIYSATAPPDLRPDPMYTFENVDVLFDNPELAADGFRAAEPMFARAIATDLARSPRP